MQTCWISVQIILHIVDICYDTTLCACVHALHDWYVNLCCAALRLSRQIMLRSTGTGAGPSHGFWVCFMTLWPSSCRQVSICNIKWVVYLWRWANHHCSCSQVFAVFVGCCCCLTTSLKLMTVVYLIIRFLLALERCRIRPPCFLVECRKRWLNQGNFVLLYSVLFVFLDGV